MSAAWMRTKTVHRTICKTTVCRQCERTYAPESNKFAGIRKRQVRFIKRRLILRDI